MAQKITEFCNRVAYVEVESYKGWSSYGRCHTIDIACVTTEGDVITRRYKGVDANTALSNFVNEVFPCDRYFITEKTHKDTLRITRHGVSDKDVYTFYLHTVTVL